MPMEEAQELRKQRALLRSNAAQAAAILFRKPLNTSKKITTKGFLEGRTTFFLKIIDVMLIRQRIEYRIQISKIVVTCHES